MKYRVTGQNKDTGARQSLEFEAESKGAAERKALQSGMTVNRVEDVTDGEPSYAGVTPGGSRGSRGGGSRIKLFIALIIVVAIIFALYRFGIIKLPK